MAGEDVLIGCAAGFAGDRKDAAPALIDALSLHDGPRFLIYEMLAERTLAQAQNERRSAPDRGYIAGFEAKLRPYLKSCVQAGVRVIGNFGAANPRAAARLVSEWAALDGLDGIRIAYVEGDDLLGLVDGDTLAATEAGASILIDRPDVLSVNVYLGATPIAQALDQGADVVITGRVADPALTLGPLMHIFGWAEDDWDRLAAGVLAGHLLECGPQITGGYFADPGVKNVPEMDRLGYPLACVSADGSFVVTKPEGTGGLVDLRSVKEQILYEIHDPAAYMTPDVVLDISAVELAQDGPDRVRVTGARGKPRPDTLKATVCVDGGLLAEAGISYAGINAEARARLAAQTLRDRVKRLLPGITLRADILGLVSVFGDTAGHALEMRHAFDPTPDLRVLISAEVASSHDGQMLIDEVEALYVAGPAGGGGVRGSLTSRLKNTACLLPRTMVHPCVSLIGAEI